MDGAAPPVRPLAESLDLVAEELAELVGLSDRIQAVISRLAASAAAPDLGIMVEAQVADLFSQRLCGITGFVRALADAERSADYAEVEAAVRALTLAEQARRLAGGPAVSAVPPDPGGHSTFWD